MMADRIGVVLAFITLLFCVPTPSDGWGLVLILWSCFLFGCCFTGVCISSARRTTK